MICRALINTAQDEENTRWNEKDYKLLKSVKNSHVGHNNTPHFGAQGKYFSFGVNAPTPFPVPSIFSVSMVILINLISFQVLD